MKINIKDTDVNYIQYGEGKDILLLHGWGQNIEMMKPIGDALCDKFRITILDFPGFGGSAEPDVVWNISDYSLMLEEFVKKLGIKKPIIIAPAMNCNMWENFYKYLQDTGLFGIISAIFCESMGKERLWLNHNTVWRALSAPKVS